MSPSADNASASGWLVYAPPDRQQQWPWSKSRSWLLALLGLLVVAVLSILWAIPHFEKRLDASARADFRAAGVDTETMSLDWNYRNVTVSGVLPAGAGYDDIANVLRRTDGEGVRRIQLNLSEPRPTEQETGDSQPPVQTESPAPEPDATPVPEPKLAVSVISDGVTVNLAGTVLNAEQRDSLVNAALAADGVVNINDDLEIAANGAADEVSDAHLARFSELLSHMGAQQVSHAEATLADNSLNYRIKAKDRSSAAVIEQAVSVAMVDFQISGEIDHIKTGEIDASATRKGNQIVLTGSVLNEEQRRRLIFAAEDALREGESVVDELVVSNQEPRLGGAEERVDRMSAVVASVGRASDGVVRLHADTLSVTATVESEEAASRIQSMLADANEAGLVTEQNIAIEQVLDSDAAQQLSMQQQIDSLWPEIQRKVVFETGTATLSAGATEVLDKVIAVINDYPQLLIEIEGHTDNVGRSEVNRRLSEERAQSVADYLIERSVAADRLMAIGYGERKPITENDTAEGRRQNRRVQFKAVPEFSNVPLEAQTSGNN